MRGGISYTYGHWLSCLQRNDADRAILGFYTSLTYGMSRDTYAGVEITPLRTGENAPTLPHLYSGTQQLSLLRHMLVREDGDALLLGQAIPRQWLAAGKKVEVRDAPTQRKPDAILIYLRHPQRLPIESVTVNGVAGEDSTVDSVTLRDCVGS